MLVYHMLVGYIQRIPVSYVTNDRVTMTEILVIGGGIKLDFRHLLIGPSSPLQLFHVQSSSANRDNFKKNIRIIPDF